MDSIFQALSHPARRRILELLKAGAKSAGDIAAAFELSKPTLSGHFNKLKAANLISAEHQGTTIMYRLNVSVLEEAILSFMSLLSNNSEVRDED